MALVGSPRQNFILFPVLPAEIRTKIWRFALPGPRLVKIALTQVPKMKTKDGTEEDRRVNQFVSSTQPPVILRVCHESRYEALKFYTVTFPSKASPAQIYLDFKIDTILFPYSSYFPHEKPSAGTNSGKKYQNLLHNEFKNVRFLAIYEDHIYKDIRLLERTNFPNLEKITILLPRGGIPFEGTHQWRKNERRDGIAITEHQNSGDKHIWICHSDGIYQDLRYLWIRDMSERAKTDGVDPFNIVYGSLVKHMSQIENHEESSNSTCDGDWTGHQSSSNNIFHAPMKF